MKKPYLFFREGGFYPIECEDDQEACEQAELNPGTITVEDIDRNVIWERPGGAH